MSVCLYSDDRKSPAPHHSSTDGVSGLVGGSIKSASFSMLVNVLFFYKTEYFRLYSLRSTIKYQAALHAVRVRDIAFEKGVQDFIGQGPC